MSTLSRVKLVSSNSQIAKYLSFHGVPINYEMFLRAWAKGNIIYIEIEFPNGSKQMLCCHSLILDQADEPAGIIVANKICAAWRGFLAWDQQPLHKMACQKQGEIFPFQAT